MKSFLPVLLLATSALAAPDHGYGYQQAAPKLYCRDTNTSIYAEVCVPSVATETKPVTLDVKRVADDQFCYTASKTECEETTKVEDREVCTYTYESKKETRGATTTQITYEEKSETMKVTSCRPSGYGKPQYGGYGKPSGGEHQICREEYQTQEYRVPLVNEPLEVGVEVAAPQPVKVCETVKVELTEVVCKDVEEERCIDLAKLEDGTTSVDQTEAILGEPDCEQLTLTLPTEACSKQHHHHGYQG